MVPAKVGMTGAAPSIDKDIMILKKTELFGARYEPDILENDGQINTGMEENIMKDVMILTGAGQIGMAIARRMGYGKKIVIGDKKLENAQAVAKIMKDAGFDTVALETDLSSRASIQNLLAEAQKLGRIAMLVNAAGVSPSQAPIEAIPGSTLSHPGSL